MKKFLLLPMFLFLVGCSDDSTEVAFEDEQSHLEQTLAHRHHETDIYFVNNIIAYTKNIVYTKDERTDLCFAWQFRRMSNVPCESIPADLLIIVSPQYPTPINDTNRLRPIHN